MRKNLSFLLTVGIIVMLFIGCSSHAYKVPVERELLKSYLLGDTYHTKIGDKMISFKYGRAYVMFEAKETCLSDDPKVPSILKGDAWVAWFGDSDEIIILKENSRLHAHQAGWYYDYGLRLDINEAFILKEKPCVAVFINTPHVYLADYSKYKKRSKSWNKDKLDIFKLSDEKYYSGDDLRQSELIFNGREKDTVFLLYREYTGTGLARTPFYQQLRYNIKDSSIINFKSLRVEVLDATNEGITFKVLSDADVPWMRIG